jgi:predicted enzyme related to lactoylglutathione lyase
VPDVLAAQREVFNAGGAAVGDIVTLQTATGARVTWCYTRDPEGNVIELQSWS